VIVVLETFDYLRHQFAYTLCHYYHLTAEYCSCYQSAGEVVFADGWISLWLYVGHTLWSVL